MTAPSFLVRPDGPPLAYRWRAGRGPAIVFLPGYMSDMEGGKAVALDAWTEREGRAMLRLDYAGCGASGGAFEDGTLDIWRDDVVRSIEALVEGPVVLVGSSMGGWLMLLVAAALPPGRVVGLVGIAAAPDFTDWGFGPTERERLLRDGRIEEPSDYADQPYVTTRAFWESGQANLLLERGVPFDGPVRLLHGQRDADVPWDLSPRLAAALGSADVQVTLIKDGDHRLSRESDIALLIAIVDRLLETL